MSTYSSCKWTMSSASFYQNHSGTGIDRRGAVTGLADISALWRTQQFLVTCFTCSLRPGRHYRSRSLCLVLIIPGWVSCARPIIVVINDAGMTMRFCRSNKLSTTANSLSPRKNVTMLEFRPLLLSHLVAVYSITSCDVWCTPSCRVTQMKQSLHGQNSMEVKTVHLPLCCRCLGSIRLRSCSVAGDLTPVRSLRTFGFSLHIIRVTNAWWPVIRDLFSQRNTCQCSRAQTQARAFLWHLRRPGPKHVVCRKLGRYELCLLW